jgi:hypothetical protein
VGTTAVRGTRCAVRGARCCWLLAAGCWCWLLVLVPEPGCWAVGGCGLGLDAAHDIWHVVHAGAGVRGVSASELQCSSSSTSTSTADADGSKVQSSKLVPNGKWWSGEWCVVLSVMGASWFQVPSGGVANCVV